MKQTVFAFLFFVSLTFFSQENNYWNRQYGAKSTLLCGAAVATYFDNGAIFYNPATLCFKDSGNISLSANLYQGEFIKRKDALGPGIDLSNSNFNFSPQIVSANKKIGKKTELEFILLSKTNTDFNLSRSHYSITHLSFFNNALSQYIGTYSFRKHVVDDWAGVSMSFKLTDKIGIGFGNFYSYRFERYIMSVNSSAVSIDTNYHFISKSDSLFNYSYYNVSTILKAGFVYHGEKNNFGLTFTAPSIAIYGRGKSENSLYFSDPNIGPWANYVVYVKSISSKAKYKLPLSVALGYSLHLRRSQFHVTVEWFNAVKPYEALQNPNEARKADGNVSFGGKFITGIWEMKKQVTNFAMGWEKTLKGTTELLLGFSSDFNSKANNYAGINRTSYNLSQSGFNIWHGSAGIAFQHKKNNIAVGINVAYGTSGGMQVADFVHPNDMTRLFGMPQNKCVNTYRSAGIVVGLTY